MPHALTSNLVHCVFSTKDRASSIADPQSLWRYLAGVAREKKIPLIIAGGTPNHVHLLIALPAATCLAKAVQELKAIVHAG
ncbi:MAG: transposase [Terriglobales bacterium]